MPGPPVPAATPVPQPPLEARTATVERVVDGDTLVAVVGARRVRVRLIGVDAPESVQPHHPVECFGKAASRYTAALLPVGQSVRWSTESGGDRDRFGRLLWDVWLPDGRFVQAELVRSGHARARQVGPQREHAAYLARLATSARLHGSGLWGACPSPRR